MTRKRIGDVLQERGSIDRAVLERALELQRQRKIRDRKQTRLGEILLHEFKLKKHEVATAIEEVQKTIYTECRHAVISPEVSGLIPRAVAIKCCAFPIKIEDNCLVVVLAEPQNLAFLNELQFCCKLKISP